MTHDNLTFAQLRPAERLWASKLDAITDAELVGLVLGTGIIGKNCTVVGQELLAHIGGLRELLRATPEELAAVRGIGYMRAARILAAVEIVRRGHLLRTRTAPLAGPQAIFDHFVCRLGSLQQEVVYAVALDSRSRITGDYEVARGTLLSVNFHPREFFRPLLRVGAAAAVVVHNHPSGDPAPSAEDIVVTARLRDAGAVLSLPVLDHVIIAGDSYCSVADELGADF